jgi:hypothetical protein
LSAPEVAGQGLSPEPIVDEDVETGPSAYQRESHADKSAGRLLILARELISQLEQLGHAIAIHQPISCCPH